jgi:glycosyltransferase involved in cell wall biosynthesis
MSHRSQTQANDLEQSEQLHSTTDVLALDVPAFLPPITSRYLLVSCIECYRDSDGWRYLDELWYKDLLQHLKYIKNLTLACPCRDSGGLPEGAIALDSHPEFAQVRYVDLPVVHSFWDALLKLPITVPKLWTAIQRTDIVHTGVAGWPIPLGWLTTLMLQFQKKFYVIIVESAFWRLQSDAPKKLTSILRAHVSEIINRWCVNRANLTIFTQEEYRRSLLTNPQKPGHVIHASWIDKQVIISESKAIELWHQKTTSVEALKIVFVGRFLREKGISVLLKAMQILSAENVPVKLDMIGRGELLDECEKVSQSIDSPVEIRLLGMVPYGPKLFEQLRHYHAIVVPSISDEQPRIVYDAYSQALPVLASNTAGLRDCVQDSVTGILMEPNNPVALANVFKWSLQKVHHLEKTGLRARQVAQTMTHEEMHRQRWQLLLDTFGIHD